MAPKKAPAKAKPAAKKAAPRRAPDTLSPEDAGDANGLYNIGLRLMVSIEAQLRDGTAMASSAKVVEEAEANLTKALKLADNHGRARIMLGNLYRYTARPDDGIPHFEKALGLPPESDDWVKAVDGLASCHMMLGVDAPAVKALKLGIKHHPSESLFHFKLGAVHVDAGRLPEAKKSLEQVLKIEPGHEQAQELLRNIGGGAPAAATPAFSNAGNVDYAAVQKKTEKLAKDLQEKMMKLMSGPGSPEDKTKRSLKLQEEFQKQVQKLYGA